MGCGSSKEGTSITSLKLAPVGVKSVDSFNDQVEVVINNCAKIEDGITKARKALGAVAGFDAAGKGSSLKQTVTGILLMCLCAANGDMSKLKIEIINKKPYFKISLNGMTSESIPKLINAFEEYIDALVDAIEEKLPKIIEEITELSDKVATLKDNAADEFEALSDWDKVQAVSKTVKLVADLPKIPAYIKKFLKDIQAEITQLLDLQADLADMTKIIADGKKCAADKISNTAYLCFKHIYPTA